MCADGRRRWADRGGEHGAMKYRRWRTYKAEPNLVPVKVGRVRVGKRGPERTYYDYDESATMFKPRPNALQALLFPEYFPRRRGRMLLWSRWRLELLLALVDMFTAGVVDGQDDLSPEAAFVWIAKGRFLEDWLGKGHGHKGSGYNRTSPYSALTLRRKYMEIQRRRKT